MSENELACIAQAILTEQPFAECPAGFRGGMTPRTVRIVGVHNESILARRVDGEDFVWAYRRASNDIASTLYITVGGSKWFYWGTHAV